MAKWYSEIYPEASEITLSDHVLRQKLEAIIDKWTTEMEGYSYFGSNPGVPRDSYEDVAEDIMTELDLWEKPKYTLTGGDLKMLREMTGEGLMACKRALLACNGDMAKSVEYIRRMGQL